MSPQFELIKVKTMAELDRYGVREFAASFGHKPVGLPIILWFTAGELVAYVEVRNTPILYPAVHHEISPRVFLAGGQQLAELVAREYEGAFVIYDRRSAHFEPEQMGRLGFALSPLKFFEVNPQQKETEHGS